MFSGCFQVAISLGCIILSNTKNQDILNEQPDFKFVVLLDLLKSKNTVGFVLYVYGQFDQVYETSFCALFY